jgi:hypothetical protein
MYEDARNGGRARADDARAEGTRDTKRSQPSVEAMPADGTALPIGRSGDFGTSPFLGQLTSKTLLVSYDMGFGREAQ